MAGLEQARIATEDMEALRLVVIDHLSDVEGAFACSGEDVYCVHGDAVMTLKLCRDALDRALKIASATTWPEAVASYANW